MSDINIARHHSLPLAVAKLRVQKTADELNTEHNFRSAWHGNTLSFERSGLHGEIYVSDSEVRLQVTLGLLMKPLKRKLMDRIEEKLERLFPAEQAGTQIAKPAGRSARTACGVESEKKARPALLPQRR